MVVVSLLTVMLGVAFTALSVSGPPEPAFSVQLCALPWSPKTRLPILIAPSNVTVAFAFRSSALKSAVKPIPCAMFPPCQLDALSQLPPLGLIQEPFCDDNADPDETLISIELLAVLLTSVAATKAGNAPR